MADKFRPIYVVKCVLSIDLYGLSEIRSSAVSVEWPVR